MKPTATKAKTRSVKVPAAEDKLDLLKRHKADYVAPASPVLLEIAPAGYLAIEGTGAPSGPLFSARLSALYGLAFTVKMSRKAAGLGDYSICRLEAIYGRESLEGSASMEHCRWTILLRTPDFVTDDDLAAAVALLRKRGKEGDAGLVRRLRLEEGTCVQALHTGPYEREQETVARMREFARLKGFAQAGDHHEIYLSDPRHVEPDKLKTILRIPVRSLPDAGR